MEEKAEFMSLQDAKRATFASGAYADMARRQLKWPEGSDWKLKEQYKQSLCHEMIRLVEDNLPCFPKQFSSIHKKLCESIKAFANAYDKTKPIRPFTLGLSQKIINMYMKYLWLLGDPLIEGLEKELHAPLDDKIVRCLRIPNSQNWGSIDDYEKYLEYQKAASLKVSSIQGCKSRIEWETRYWAK
jgi:hypothetical protein